MIGGLFQVFCALIDFFIYLLYQFLREKCWNLFVVSVLSAFAPYILKLCYSVHKQLEYLWPLDDICSVIIYEMTFFISINIFALKSALSNMMSFINNSVIRVIWLISLLIMSHIFLNFCRPGKFLIEYQLWWFIPGCVVGIFVSYKYFNALF